MDKNAEPKILGDAKNEIDRQFLDSNRAKEIYFVVE